MKKLSDAFEGLLVDSRYLVVIAVVASLISAVAAFYMASVDVYFVLSGLLGYADPSLTIEARMDLRAETITSIVKAVDGYLLAAVMIIFAIGLYELFISRVARFDSPIGFSKVLVIHTFDELKDRLSRVILLILVVKFLQLAMSMKYEKPIELLYLGIALLMVGGALFLGNLHTGVESEAEKAAANGLPSEKTT